MPSYYNEIDPFAAAWLRELISQGRIAPGDVDTRSIEDVTPDELRKYTQCHFFAGIGVWSYALRRAGWSDDRPVWTGSCPCQPFSAAGKGTGFADERHLWPALFHLIRECRPSVVFGEQVASKDGLAWLDLVQADLEGENYANAAIDLCAAGVGAPHIRQRLFWIGERLGDTISPRLEGHGGNGDYSDQPRRIGADAAGSVAQASAVGRLADAEIVRRREGIAHTGWMRCGNHAQRETRRSAIYGSLDDAGRPCPTNGLWRDADWLFCRDGKWRPVEPGTFPLAHGAPARVGRLRGYGNAINAEVATAFIEAYMNPVEAEIEPADDQLDLFPIAPITLGV